MNSQTQAGAIEYHDLDDLKAWPTELLQGQYEAELAEHRRLLENDPQIDGPLTGSRQKYHESLDRSYRLGYLRWLLAGAPKPQPRFI